jgi:hypothetical protein
MFPWHGAVQVSSAGHHATYLGANHWTRRYPELQHDAAALFTFTSFQAYIALGRFPQLQSWRDENRIPRSQQAFSNADVAFWYVASMIGAIGDSG